MEVRPKHTIAMTRQGTYIRIKTLPHYKVGNEINIPAASSAKNRVRYLAAAAAFVFCVGLFGFIYAYATPYSYVNLDTNPSIEITVNRFDYIIHTRGINTDGDTLLSKHSVLNKPLKSGIHILLDSLSEADYITAENPDTLVFTIVSDSQKERTRFDKTVSAALDEKAYDLSQVAVYIIHADRQAHSDAEQYNLSSGRYLLIRELQKKAGEELNPTALRDVPIAQIVKMVRENASEETGGDRAIGREDFLRPVTPRRQRQQRQDNRERETEQTVQERQR